MERLNYEHDEPTGGGKEQGRSSSVPGVVRVVSLWCEGFFVSFVVY